MSGLNFFKRLLKQGMILLLLISGLVSHAQTIPTYTVTTYEDSGAGSLREAINNVNASANGGKVIFNINPTVAQPVPPFVIKLVTKLPTINKKIIIDGTTQPAFTYTGIEPTIVINGELIPDMTVNGDYPNTAFVIFSDESSIEGLTMISFYSFGVALDGADKTVIRNNVIYGTEGGVRMSNSGDCIIQRNFIGTNRGKTINPVNCGFAGECFSAIAMGGSPALNNSSIVNPCVNNLIGGDIEEDGNVFANYYAGILSFDARNNRFLKNIFLNNSNENIGFFQSNDNHPAPYNLMSSATAVSGQATPGDIVEVFLSNSTKKDAVKYIGSSLTLPNGEWELGGITVGVGSKFVATATDPVKKNTSKFSEAQLSECQNVVLDQNAKIQLLQPSNFQHVDLNTAILQYKINSVPGASEYKLRLEIAPPREENATGRLIPDWVQATGFETVSATLSPGTFNKLLKDYVTSSSTVPQHYFWRVGIQYQPANGSFQPVLWSETQQFIISPAQVTIEAASYLTNDAQHTNNINWAYGITYKDNGLTSEGIVYVDGMGKSRQVQSMINTSNALLITESAYSEEGGGMVQTLPAPLQTADGGHQRFGYAYRFFDVVDGTALRDFSTQDFDREKKGATTNTLSEPSPTDQSQEGTVGWYYSSNNYKDPYVDDSKGFPYSYGVGYNSPLKRPMLTQAGLGEDFKLTTRSNKYYYGHPSQEELYRVYGVNKAPLCDKIAKTVVYDVDGVGHVTYTDNESKVIATALTVCNAPSLKPLVEDGMDGVTIHVDALNTDLMDETSLVRTASSKFFIPCCTTDVNLTYDLDLASFQLNQQTPCQDCKYDLEISVINESTGKEEYHYPETGGTEILPSASTCPPNNAEHKTISKILHLCGPGNYVINRTIRPYTDPTTGKNLITTAVDEYLNYIETHKTELLSDFTTKFYTRTKYFVLRAQRSPDKWYSYNDFCAADVTHYTGTVLGDQCGNVVDAKYNSPVAITKDVIGNYFIADMNANCIRKINIDGNVTILSGGQTGGFDDGLNTVATFHFPKDVVCRPYVGVGNDQFAASVVVADSYNNAIRLVNSTTGFTTTIARATDGISNPYGVAIDAYNTIYVASYGNNRIYKIVLSSGTPVITRIASAYTFNLPTDITVDKNGDLFVTNLGTNEILKINAAEVVSTVYTFPNGSNLTSLIDDPKDNLYVTETNKIFKVYPATGTSKLIVGSVQGNVDGDKYTATFNSPTGIYADGTSILYVAEAPNSDIRKIAISDCLQNPEVFENSIIPYADEVTLKPITENPYTYDMVDMDGGVDPKVGPGDEHYKLTGITLGGAVDNTTKDNFIMAYKHQTGIDLTGKIDDSKSELYTVNANSQLSSTIALLDTKNMLEPQNMLPYKLLKLTYTDPSCEQSCVTNEVINCNNQCNEQLMSHKADMDEAYANLSKSTYLYQSYFNGPHLSLTAFVLKHYPLNYFMLNKLRETDKPLYDAYENARFAIENFNFNECAAMCNNTPLSACDKCEPTYESCVFANMNSLFGGYNYFVDKWDAMLDANPNAPFPYTLDKLIHGTAPNTYHDQVEEENLGKELFNLIVAHINDPVYTNRSNWDVQGGSCPSCQPSGSVSPLCPPAPLRDMSQFPKILIPALELMNVDCGKQYNSCLQLNGTIEQQHIQACQNLRDECLDGLGSEPQPANSTNEDWVTWNTNIAACHTSHTNCLNNVSPNPIEEERKDIILETLKKLYPKSSQQTTVNTLLAQLLTQTSAMTRDELVKFLMKYEDEQECILSCRKVLQDAFDVYISELKKKATETVKDIFKTGCYARMNEKLDINYEQSIYHYTLYNYDFANNLVSTVPPEGVDYIYLDEANEYTRSPLWSREPQHRLLTTKKHTSLYTITHTTPDEGATRYLYDKAGRLRFSQTSEQLERGQQLNYLIFSYVKYDNENRLIESGEYRDRSHQIVDWSYEFCDIVPCVAAHFPDFYLSTRVNSFDWPNEPSNTFEELYVEYDKPSLPSNTPAPQYGQFYLAGNVSKTYNKDATTDQISSTTHYSYDGHGRMTFAVQEADAFESANTDRYKTIDYNYQNLSGRVDNIVYQRGVNQETFYQKFTYDADNRIIKTEASRNGQTWIPTSDYGYYLHGPVKRIGLGNKIQDLDYVYNVSGWLKSINNPLTTAYANDANESTSSLNFAPDVFSEAVNYFNGDYKRLNVGLDNTQKTVPQNGTDLFNKSKDLFGGGISSTITNTAFNKTEPATNIDNILAQGYHYDYLQRLTDVYAEEKPENFTAFATAGAGTDAYASHITYDPNGNIQSFIRNSNLRTVLNVGITTQMDQMTYKYAQTTQDFHNRERITTNRLAHVYDDAESEYEDDIKDQGRSYDKTVPNSHNYKYDAKGRIIKDLINNIYSISWTSADKVRRIQKTDGTIITFTYNAQLQRLTKRVAPPFAFADVTTIYSYSETGTLLSTYENKYDYNENQYKYKLKDHQLYGLGRLGVYEVNENLVSSSGQPANDPAKALFEIQDHLGSVRAVVSGEKDGNGNAKISQLSDYHEFGMAMEGRRFGDGYRFGYQGSEKDVEINGGQYTTEFRALDVRLGRWFSPDMITHTSWSPYAAMNNNPISVTDELGLEGNGDPVDPKIGDTDCRPGDVRSDGSIEPGFPDIGGALGGMGSSTNPWELNPVDISPSTPPAIDLNVVETFSPENTAGTVDDVIDGGARALKYAEAVGLGDLNAFGSDLNPLEGIPFVSLRKDPRDVYPGDPQLQLAFALGQLAGDARALLVSANEINAGGGVVLTTGATGVGAVVGGGVVLHGLLTGKNATIGIAKTLVIITSINAISHGSNSSDSDAASGDGGGTSDGNYPKDYSTKNTKNQSGTFKSEREARNVARTKLGKNPIQVEPNKWRSRDGKWQYRAKPGDLKDKHIHLEELNPKTGEVLQNYHLRW